MTFWKRIQSCWPHMLSGASQLRRDRTSIIHQMTQTLFCYRSGHCFGARPVCITETVSLNGCYVLQLLLHCHARWLKVQRCSDRFEEHLGIRQLRETRAAAAPRRRPPPPPPTGELCTRNTVKGSPPFLDENLSGSCLVPTHHAVTTTNGDSGRADPSAASSRLQWHAQSGCAGCALQANEYFTPRTWPASRLHFHTNAVSASKAVSL